MKANLYYILWVIFFFCFQSSIAQQLGKKAESEQDSISKNTKNNALLLQENDSIQNDSIKKPKEAIDFIITHDAEDYTIQNAKDKTVTLYNNAHVTYDDIDLKAGKIVVDYLKNTVYATGIKDSTGYVQRPVFKQGNQESEQDSILFNFKSEKALIYGIETVQGEMITYATKTKRVNDSTIYMRKLRFTTSKKKKPDYHIATNKAKLVPGKKIIVGASNLVISDVPTPVYLPFAYFPLTKGRSSGFIIPSWGENSLGFFLQNGGYYFVINDYFDFQITGDLYSNGAWGLNSNSNYYVRYKYSGGLRLRYQNLISSIRGFSDYSKSSSYAINWNHSQDSKSSPNSRLSASVNFSSNSNFYKQSLNEVDQNQFLTNSFSSSINYYKKFVGTPFNMSTTITHSQNSNTEAVTMTLPSLQLNMDRIYPFTGKGGAKKNPIQKIGVNYAMTGEYRINTTDEEFFKPIMFREAQSGVKHRMSANTNIKALKYFTISPSANYEDIWSFRKIKKTYDPDSETAVNDTINGFSRYNKYNFSVSFGTNIYGTFKFKKGRIKAIRHTIRPSISWGYTPNLARQHQERVRTSPTTISTYTPFDIGLYGGPSGSLSNSIGFTLNNVFEAKVEPKEGEETDEEYKKVTLLNNLNFSTSYNIAADSLRWSNLRFSTGTSLFKQKMAVNLNGSFNPYQVTSTGTKINKFNSDLLRLENATLTANYRFSSEDFDKDAKDKNKNDQDPNNPPDVTGSDQDLSTTNSFPNDPLKGKEREEKTAELYSAKIPWNISFNYSARYSNNGYSNIGISTHTLGFSGSVEPSPKWKVGFRSGYNILDGRFTYTSMNFARDLDSWRMSFNWIPFGDNTSYNFFIGVKSSMLSDLKWDKNKPPDRRLF